jgi:hypothetical protein
MRFFVHHFGSDIETSYYRLAGNAKETPPTTIHEPVKTIGKSTIVFSNLAPSPGQAGPRTNRPAAPIAS